LLISEEVSLQQRSHSEFVTVAIERILAMATIKISELDQLAITIGPGSFTGIRVSVGLAKALSYALKIPIWTIDTLSVLRSQVPLESACFASLNAYKNLVFGSYFAPGKMVTQPSVFTYESVASLLLEKSKSTKITLIGDGLPLFSNLISSQIEKNQLLVSAAESSPRAKYLGELFLNFKICGQTIDWKLLNPLYLRGSEAEENLKIHSRRVDER
jgi:tRNA threonylcarbamoyl adenosine modification protein YeaZ